MAVVSDPTDLSRLNFAKGDGLLPAIIQDADTGAVLMLGYMNAAALAATRERGRVVFFSRSRQQLWEKGETSGHTLTVEAIRTDCDADPVHVGKRITGGHQQAGHRERRHARSANREMAAPDPCLWQLQRAMRRRDHECTDRQVVQ